MYTHGQGMLTDLQRRHLDERGFFFTDVLLNVISGNFSTSKKSAVRRWLSRFVTPVSIDVVFAANVTLDRVTSSAL